MFSKYRMIEFGNHDVFPALRDRHQPTTIGQGGGGARGRTDCGVTDRIPMTRRARRLQSDALS
jgi:hypothetical protein